MKKMLILNMVAESEDYVQITADITFASAWAIVIMTFYEEGKGPLAP